MKRLQSKRAKRATPIRQDGLATRNQLLEAAGEIFAEQGYAKATSKEICERANANVAAVNYHFGGKDQLYAAVLQEAHARIVSIEAMAAAAQSRVDPKQKLRMFMTLIAEQAAKRDRGGWELRVLGREVLSGSPFMATLMEKQIAPKAALLRSILGELMRLPADHPAVSRTVISLMGPFLMMLIIDRALQKKVAPHLETDAETLTEHMVTYALAGIEAVARKVRKE